MRHGGYYNHELTDDDHIQLLNQLNDVSGLVILSGYESQIYNDMLKKWFKYSTTSRISAGRGTAVRTETVWLNAACNEQQVQTKLFNNIS